MSTVNYSVIPADTANLGIEAYSTPDIALINSFQINSRYDLTQHFIEAHVYSLTNERLTSVYNYQGEKQLLNSAGAGQEGASTLYIDPVLDAENLGYERGGVILLYHFLKPIIAPSLYITEISPDRLEIRAAGVEDSVPDLETLQELKSQLQDNSFFSEFRLNFLNNDLYIGVNIDIDTDGSILFKLYEPLPESIAVKTSFRLVSFVADSVSYEVAATFTPDPVQFNFLKGPNFSIDNREQSSLSTEYLSYNDIYSYPVTSSYHKLLLQASQSGIEVSVDYTDFNNFVHFSSAVERLENFKYKLDLVQYYESKSLSIKNTLSVNASAAVSESSTYYDKSVAGVIEKLDGYEQYLYFESTSFSWPKSNTLPPFLNLTSSNATSINWFNGQIASASLYDELNQSSLVYTIPEFIRQDNDNAPYSLFINMVGQHFDNIWLYAKAVTDKYDGDNRLDYGISKDLIGEALKSFGVKLYSSNFSVANLSSLLLGEWYDSGSEQISSFVTASNFPTPDKDIIQDTYKRIYHNLPYLIKTKGTERGLRALINCFGIPNSSLEIKSLGGVDRTALPYFGVVTGSVDKIRLDNTGSIVPGDTLSKYTSIQNLDEQYTHDQHVIEVGFSPSYYIDKYIHSNITANFNIDQYIGDPRTAQDSSYSNDTYGNLNRVAETILSGSSAYDVRDFVRLIKFFDNQLFKMVKDFVPARDTTSSGIIIKPHILNRSKVKSVQSSGTRPEYIGSIDTAFITGSNGGVLADYSTAHSQSLRTPLGPLVKILNANEETINGELGGSNLRLYTGSLNVNNTFKKIEQPLLTFNVINTTNPTSLAGSISAGDIYIWTQFNTIFGELSLTPST